MPGVFSMPRPTTGSSASLTEVSSTPRPVISIRTVSPGWRVTGGLRENPAPAYPWRSGSQAPGSSASCAWPMASRRRGSSFLQSTITFCAWTASSGTTKSLAFST